MAETTTQNALWTPGWYELDQTLVLNERQKFWFFHEPPEECQSQATAEGTIELVFYNQLDSTKNCDVRYAKIVEMHHPQLGSLVEVDTDGLDYIFYPVDGEEIIVNAEEEPGATYAEGTPISDWSVFVKLDEVSEPVNEAAP